ncbi:MAG: hypothetical protein ACLSVD_07980 [Eggerthellaceae bacterium]
MRTDIPSSVQMPGGKFGGVAGEYRVRNVLVNGEPLDVNRRYKLVSHTFLLVDGGDGLTMFMNDEAVLLDLDNKALIEYIQYDLKGTIGGEYADPDGQGRIVIEAGPTRALAATHARADRRACRGARARRQAAGEHRRSLRRRSRWSRRGRRSCEPLPWARDAKRFLPGHTERLGANPQP